MFKYLKRLLVLHSNKSIPDVCQALHFPWAEVDWSLTLDRSDGREGSEKVDSSFRGLTLRLAQRGAHLAWIYFASWLKENRKKQSTIQCVYLVVEYMRRATYYMLFYVLCISMLCKYNGAIIILWISFEENQSWHIKIYIYVIYCIYVYICTSTV